VDPAADLPAARARFRVASRAAQDALLDILNAERHDDQAAREQTLAAFVDLQQAAITAHDEFIAAADQHQIPQADRDTLDQQRALLEQHLVAAQYELHLVQSVVSPAPAE
jgi:hypothetical protein